jgi:hypothetical protein
MSDPQVMMIIEMNQAKEARRRARRHAAKPPAVRKIADKRRKVLDRISKREEKQS